MIHRWIPWKFIVKQAARAYGIVDPLSVMARLRRFAQPSEVQEPIELLRAGIIFHARGLVNTKAIQHNLDWVWPYWVERQFNPKDVSFIPRGFSFSHVNLTHRNWTAVGSPDCNLYPIVDPRGLFTPVYDGWSLDLWLRLPDGQMILPSREERAEQRLSTEPTLQVETKVKSASWELCSWCSLETEHQPTACMQVQAKAPSGSCLILALRPYNPEGIQFIENVSFHPTAASWLVNASTHVLFDHSPDQVFFSEYTQGDVLHRLHSPARDMAISCKVGMATAAALFPLSQKGQTQITARIPLKQESKISSKRDPRPAPEQTWSQSLQETCQLHTPEERLNTLYDTALRSLILLSARDVVPGPYTYRRFWFRDACFMLHALATLGFCSRVERIIQAFPARQKKSGYFQSQAGEWDSNGQVLWLLDRFEQLTGRSLDARWIQPVLSGVKWIQTKRLSSTSEALHAGLLPAGFSAEHLGPNDYYYWDNFWGAAGLQAASRLLQRHGYTRQSQSAQASAHNFLHSIWTSLERAPDNRRFGGIPASPYRRLDAGAIGSLVADYPLQITPPGEASMMTTVDFLMQHCFHKGGFFQDMIHSGINPYLTLCIAQTLLRTQDLSCLDLLRAVADLASPTGQWPEAIHPLTLGGCMGDGQHGWAASEWVMMLRNLFVREEGDGLILGSGIDPKWLQTKTPLQCGPTLTPYGQIRVHVQGLENQATVRISGNVNPEQTPIDLALPGYSQIRIHSCDQEYTVSPIRP